MEYHFVRKMFLGCLVPILLVVFYCLPKESYADVLTVEEDELKAAILVKFLKYVSPSNVEQAENIKFCVAAGDDFYRLVVQFNQTQAHKKIHVANILLGAQGDCDIVYLSREIQPSTYQNALPSFQESVIMTDNEDIFQRFGMIYIFRTNQNISFKVNLKKAKQISARVDVRLLNNASEIVQD